jgi:choline dehydrogenase
MQRDINRIDADRYSPGLFQVPLHIDGLKQRNGAWQYLHETLTAKAEDGIPIDCQHALPGHTCAAQTREW